VSFTIRRAVLLGSALALLAGCSVTPDPGIAGAPVPVTVGPVPVAAPPIGDQLPGMPPVTDPHNVYAADRAGDGMNDLARASLLFTPLLVGFALNGGCIKTGLLHALARPVDGGAVLDVPASPHGCVADGGPRRPAGLRACLPCGDAHPQGAGGPGRGVPASSQRGGVLLLVGRRSGAYRARPPAPRPHPR